MLPLFSEHILNELLFVPMIWLLNALEDFDSKSYHKHARALCFTFVSGHCRHIPPKCSCFVFLVFLVGIVVFFYLA
jgi:hypothetical protein